MVAAAPVGDDDGVSESTDCGADLDGMTFVITGAARGIGAETARLAASRGAAVVVSDVLVEAGRHTAATIRDAGGRAAFVAADVADPAAVDG